MVLVSFVTTRIRNLRFDGVHGGVYVRGDKRRAYDTRERKKQQRVHVTEVGKLIWGANIVVTR